MIPGPYSLPLCPELLEGALPESKDEVHLSVGVEAVAEQQVLVQPRTVRPLSCEGARRALGAAIRVGAGDHARLIRTRRLRRANPSTRDRASPSSQYRRSRCPHSDRLYWLEGEARSLVLGLARRRRRVRMRR